MLLEILKEDFVLVKIGMLLIQGTNSVGKD